MVAAQARHVRESRVATGIICQWHYYTTYTEGFADPRSLMHYLSMALLYNVYKKFFGSAQALSSPRGPLPCLLCVDGGEARARGVLCWICYARLNCCNQGIPILIRSLVMTPGFMLSCGYQLGHSEGIRSLFTGLQWVQPVLGWRGPTAESDATRQISWRHAWVLCACGVTVGQSSQT